MCPIYNSHNGRNLTNDQTSPEQHQTNSCPRWLPPTQIISTSGVGPDFLGLLSTGNDQRNRRGAEHAEVTQRIGVVFSSCDFVDRSVCPEKKGDPGSHTNQHKTRYHTFEPKLQRSYYSTKQKVRYCIHCFVGSWNTKLHGGVAEQHSRNQTFPAKAQSSKRQRE
jgi:hypothetical protein